jgi:alpha-galactosidase
VKTQLFVIGAVFMFSAILPSEVLGAERVAQVANLDVSKISQTIERPRTTGAGSAVSIGGTKFERSIPTRAKSRLYIQLDGHALSFSALGGISDSDRTNLVTFRGVVGQVEFLIYGDGKLLKRSGLVKQGDPAVSLQANLAGVRELLLAVDGPSGAFANWVQAKITYTGHTPRTVFPPEERDVKRVSSQPPEPRLNGAMVAGIRPGTPFLYTIAATGQRPMRFAANRLPTGLRLCRKTGIITGILTGSGEYAVRVTVSNALGHAEKTLRIIVGNELALTPPMGWNSWNVTEGLVSETVLEEMADAMVSYGLRDVGYQYIDMDGSWVVSRDSEGRPVADPVRFPHGLKAVADYLHARGFKMGIYSSPASTTCDGREPGTMGHQESDVKTWVTWGADLLKYDSCSTPPDQAQELYGRMGKLLKESGRSIVYSLSGTGAPAGAEWGANAQMWRTTGDIRDIWHLELEGGDGIIDSFEEQPKVTQYQHPGGWNDPDLLLAGIYGKGGSANDLAAKGANDIEYRTQMSLWAMLSAPLLASADLRVISPAALEILTNPEVIEVDQDLLGREPTLSLRQGEVEVWSKDMADGSKALALLNRGEQPITITAKWSDIGLSGRQRVRDLWQRKDVGVFTDRFSTSVPRHGTAVVQIWAVK